MAENKAIKKPKPVPAPRPTTHPDTLKKDQGQRRQ